MSDSKYMVMDDEGNIPEENFTPKMNRVVNRYMKSKLEKAALRKSDNPNEKVLCPICGEELLFETVGTSSKISCKNRDHVDVAIRGI